MNTTEQDLARLRELADRAAGQGRSVPGRRGADKTPRGNKSGKKGK